MKKYFEIQKEFQKKLYNLDNLSYEEKVKLTKEFVLSAHKELSEVLGCLNWKSHRKEEIPFSKSNLGEESIDVFKYIINVCLLWRISSSEFDKFFDDKTAVVTQRYKQEFMKAKKGEKICAIDLDGVLNEWEKFFVKTFNKEKGTNYVNDVDIRKNTNALEYEDFKRRWRESGIKTKIPVKKGAIEFIKYLKKKGYRIVIISSRPYRTHSKIFSDTIVWLKKNSIVFDDLYFDEQKNLRILKHFPNLKFMVEDEIKCAEQVAKEGYIVFLLRNEKDRDEGGDIGQNERINIVYSLKEIEKYVD